MNYKYQYICLNSSLKNFDNNVSECIEKINKCKEFTKTAMSSFDSIKSSDSQIYPEILGLFEKIDSNINNLYASIQDARSNVDSKMQQKLNNIRYYMEKENEEQYLNE